MVPDSTFSLSVVVVTQANDPESEGERARQASVGQRCRTIQDADAAGKLGKGVEPR